MSPDPVNPLDAVVPPIVSNANPVKSTDIDFCWRVVPSPIVFFIIYYQFFIKSTLIINFFIFFLLSIYSWYFHLYYQIT